MTQLSVWRRDFGGTGDEESSMSLLVIQREKQPKFGWECGELRNIHVKNIVMLGDSVNVGNKCTWILGC